MQGGGGTSTKRQGSSCSFLLIRSGEKLYLRAVDGRAEQPPEAVELLDHSLAEGAAHDGRLVRSAVSSPA